MYQTDPPRPPNEVLPTMYDLPSEDPEEPGLPDEFHNMQPQLLRETCLPPNYPIEQVFVGTDLNLYYDVRHPLWQKRPDWFLVLGVERARQQQDLRWSYVVWQEGIAPFLVVELLSPSTEAEDLGQTLRSIDQPPTKWQVYEQLLRIPYYAVFDRYQNQLRVYQLVATRYQPIPLTESKFWFEEIQLGLAVWQGQYQNVEGRWLRWYDPEGNWIPTSTERAEQAEQQLEQERLRLEQAEQHVKQERQRAERLAERLRTMGIDPDQV